MTERETSEVSVVHAFAHVPLLQITADEQVLEGTLEQLPFPVWMQLDSGFPYADEDYERSSPVFYHEQFRAEPDEDRAWIDDAFRASVGLLYRALLLATAARLPHPRFSVWYVRDAEARSTRTMVGPFDRETILYQPAPAARLAPGDISRVAACARFLTKTRAGGEAPEIGEAFRTLERTARPEFTPLAAFLHELTAMEALLKPEVTKHPTETFARRSAALLAGEPSEREERHAQARSWYRVRNRLVHGDNVPDVPDVRRFLVVSLLRALARLEHDPELTSLPAALDEAWSSDQAFARLRGETAVVT